MTPPDTAADDLADELVARMAVYDEGLAGGSDPSFLDAAPVSAAHAGRWDRLAACLRQLRRAHPPADDPAGSNPAARPAKVFGRFVIRGELGRGGFGVVFRADDPVLDRPVALKLPRPEALAAPGVRTRFLREARAAAALDHPNLVRVYEAGEIGGVCYIASEFCPGPDLARWLRDRPGPVPPRDAAALVAAVADGVGHAHARGILHRDLKPANILLGNADCGPRTAESAAGESSSPLGDGCFDSAFRIPHSAFAPKVADFGLAKLADADDVSTTTGVVLGTPQYMAPEQAEGWADRVGAPTDVYALGAVLYELLTGRPPVPDGPLVRTLESVRSGKPAAPRGLAPAVPRDLETVCLRCLEKDPNDRYQAMADLAADLRRFLAGAPVAARRPGPWARLRGWARRPERTRDAGGFGLFNGLIAVTTNLVGAGLVSAGVFPVDRTGPAYRYFLAGIVVGVASVWAGRRAAVGRPGVLATGLGMTAAYPIFVTVCLAGGLDHGGLVNGQDRSMLMAQISTVSLLNAITAAGYVAALVAWRANRHRAGVL